MTKLSLDHPTAFTKKKKWTPSKIIYNLPSYLKLSNWPFAQSSLKKKPCMFQCRRWNVPPLLSPQDCISRTVKKREECNAWPNTLSIYWIIFRRLILIKKQAKNKWPNIYRQQKCAQFMVMGDDCAGKECYWQERGPGAGAKPGSIRTIDGSNIKECICPESKEGIGNVKGKLSQHTEWVNSARKAGRGTKERHAEWTVKQQKRQKKIHSFVLVNVFLLPSAKTVFSKYYHPFFLQRNKCHCGSMAVCTTQFNHSISRA